MDRTKVSIHKRKKFPIHFIDRVKKIYIPRNNRQKKHEQFIMTPTDIRKINRRITAAFHCFEEIQKYSDQLLCTGEIDNIEEARDVYDKFERQVPLDCPLCESSGIMLALPMLRISLKKFTMQRIKTKYF